MKKRIIFDLVLLGAVFFAPWWFVAVVAFVGGFVWQSYYEILLAGILVDILYGGITLPLRGILGVLGGVAIYFASGYFKKIVR